MNRPAEPTDPAIPDPADPLQARQVWALERIADALDVLAGITTERHRLAVADRMREAAWGSGAPTPAPGPRP